MTGHTHTAVLTALLDQLIPPNPDRAIPGAGALGLAEALLARPDLADAIDALLAQAQGAGMTPAHVRQLRAAQPDAFHLLLVETYKAYYSRPDMRAKLGLGAHPVHPGGYPVARETPDELARLTAPVRARGPVYRATVTDESHRHGK